MTTTNGERSVERLYILTRDMGGGRKERGGTFCELHMESYVVSYMSCNIQYRGNQRKTFKNV